MNGHLSRSVMARITLRQLTFGDFTETLERKKQRMELLSWYSRVWALGLEFLARGHHLGQTRIFHVGSH